MALIFGIIVVTLLIITLYIGIISFLIFILSLIPALGITIDSWVHLFAFSTCIIFWIIPYVFINVFQSIPIKNKLLNGLVKIISELLSTLLFTLYVLFLDRFFIGLSFSALGIVSIIITIMLFTVIINITGTRLKDNNK
jgi:hypothetical protein